MIIDRETEILSPVGNKDMLIAAVRSGADAVYLGAKEFSARRNAENFSLAELKEAVEYCHIRNVSVYLALNIILKDSELANAFNLAKNAYNLGVDGLIIADLGLAQALHKKIPQLRLHASTQMTVHSASALPILKEMGFCQVVLSREMSKEDIKEFCKKAKELDIKVEAFIHGALCMSMSGQCLLSAFLGGRSGNRGLCAGPCRLPFKVESGTGYDLSLKDLSLIDYINELKDLGVYSFKIEGRMKRPEYVAAATAVCREALDKGNASQELKETLKNVFSRSGFTEGYYKNELGKDMFGVRTKEDVVSADKAFPLIHSLYRNERQSVEISVKGVITENNPIALTLSDGQNEVTAMGEIPQKAKTKALDYESTLKSFTKFGGTPYIDIGGGLNLDEGIFVPSGALNALRRETVEQLNAKRVQIKHPLTEAELDFHLPEGKDYKEPEIIIRVENETQIPEDLSGIGGIIYPLEGNPQKLNLKEIPLIADVPRGIISEALIEKRLKLFKEFGFKAALCGNLAAVEIARKTGLEVIADTGLNIANSQSLEFLKELNISSAVISPEQTLSDIEFLEGSPKKGIIAYGQIPLMLFKNCPLKNGISCADCDKKGMITDRLGVEFPIRCRMGYSELLNSLPLWLADRKKEIKNCDFIILYFTRETKERASEVITAYKKGLVPDIKHTRGLYYRGVI